MNAEERLERFSRGERFLVEPERIERELAALWQEAGRNGSHARSVTRACLWNLVVLIEERPGREGSGGSEALGRCLAELPKYLASRTLVLRLEPPLPHSEQALTDVECYISANCILGAGGSKLVCSEEITLLARGPGERHLPALVRALLVPGVPSALVLAGVPEEEDRRDAALVHSVDRVLVHLDHSTRPTALSRGFMFAERLPLGLMDVGWIEDAPMRGAVAALFETPLLRDLLGSLRHIRYIAPVDRRLSARLLLAWISICLSPDLLRCVTGDSWLVPRRGSRDVRLDLETSMEREELVFLGENNHTLGKISRRVDGVTAEVGPNRAGASGSERRSEGGSEVIVHMSVHRNMTRLIARGLSTREDDPFFKRALSVARSM